MGALAAAVAGKATIGAASESGQPVQSNASVADYANRAGRVDTIGFEDALDDFSNGNIAKSLFDNVKQAWKNGTRVVNKEVIELSSISGDTTIEKDPNNNGEAAVHQVTSSLFAGANLTIEAGAILEFKQGTGLSIGNNATVTAEGTSSEPLLFTATNARPGWWDGIEFDSPDLENVITHATIEYGGRGLNGTLEFGSGALQLTNCTLRYSDTYGLSLASGTELLDGSGDNTYTENFDGAAYVRTSNINSLSTSSSFTGNSSEYVLVDANTASGAGPDNETRTWNKLDVPYRMDGDHTVSNLELEIDAGTNFEFTQQSSLDFGASARMLIEGTASDQISFGGTASKRGWWNGIYVSSTDIDNVISNAVLENGGNNYNGILLMATNAGDEAELELHDTTIRGSGSYGLYLGNKVTLKNTANNTYTNNASGAARVRTPEVQWLSATSDFTGNDNDYVLVDSRNVNSNRVDSSGVTWDAIDVPFRMNGKHEISGVKVTIDNGATFEFTETSSLQFYSGSTIDIRGIDESGVEPQPDPITFTGTDEQRGWWGGIYISSTNTDNVMKEVVIEYAGRANDGWEGNLEMATGAGDEAELIFERCRLRESEGYGLYTGNNTLLKETQNNTYTQNADGAARIMTPQTHMVSEFSEFTGNDDDHVLVDSRNVNSSSVDSSGVTWDAIDVPFRMNGKHEISGVKVTIDNGATFEFTEASSLQFYSGSTIDIRGIDETGVEPQPDPITFTGTDEQRGWWGGIYISSTNTDNVIEEVVIEYAGRANNGWEGTLEMATGAGDEAELKLKNCTLRQSEGYGLYTGNNTLLKETQNNTYTENVDGAARIRTTQMHMMSEFSDFTGNDSDYIFVNSRNINSSNVDPSSVTWSPINVPFRMQGATTHSINDVELIVDPGVTLEFNEQGQLNFESGAEMTIEGEQSNVITFTGSDSSRGWWSGIYVETDSLKNTMKFTTVEYGGSGLNGNLELATGAGDTAQLTIEDCTFQDSGGYGLYLDNGAVVSMSQNGYTSNKDGAARIRTTQMHMLDDLSDFTGNDNDYIYVNSRNINSSNVDPSSITWSAINVPFRMQGATIHSINDVALTVNPGVTLEFEEKGRLSFYSEAEMTLDGTSNSAITFTGTFKQARGWWDGIYISTPSLKNSMRHAEVRYAGRALSGAVTLGTGAGDTGRLNPMENCTVEESGGTGLTQDDGFAYINDDVCEVNTFQNNDEEDCFVDTP